MRIIELAYTQLKQRSVPVEIGHYLQQWREVVLTDAMDGDVAMSECLQGILIDVTLDGRVSADWLGIVDECLLTDEGAPLAYSSLYAERACGFAAQALQSTIAAISARYVIECLTKGESQIDFANYARLLRPKLDPATYLFLDTDISPTTLRHRMKSEITLSCAQSVALLDKAQALTEAERHNIASAIADPRKCPPTQYVSAEYYRYIALQVLGAPSLMPGSIGSALVACTEGIDVGFSDYPLSSKHDAYMGTAHRTGRDHAIHSPLTALQVRGLLPLVEDVEQATEITQRLQQYRHHIIEHPTDIPSFRMRDISAPFGVGITPLEAIGTAVLGKEDV